MSEGTAEQGIGQDSTHTRRGALAPDSVVVASGRPPHETDEPVNPPIVLSSTFRGAGLPDAGERGYARFTNPTWDPFEATLAELERAELPALAFGSGMAAIAAAMSLLPAGGTVVLPRHSYNGSLALVGDLTRRTGLRAVHVDIADTEAVIAALDTASAATPRAAAEDGPSVLLWAESPTNPMLEVADLPALLAAARERGVLTVVDNTFSTPLLQRPLEAGADVVVHSATKYLGGHSDVILGAVVTSSAPLRERLLAYRTLHGAIAGPFETWLTLRGMRTLAVRLERSQATAQLLAERLAAHPAVESVRYPGLPSDPGHTRAAAQMDGFGSVVSLTVAPGAGPAHDGGGDGGAARGRAAADAVVAALELWTPATSLGGVESLAERRRRHPGEAPSVPENLIRLSVGIENAEDLWADLARALDHAAGPHA
ncbi:PLP-dependent transferase [Zhihengliuella sp.]|uniref:trans-sulfuration enzyme family protein n=1 Tax=Zhihengliuella sp. TaxID=1954483 RepID=UPI0028123BFA|nr:PLP-dependent transferase [Zhihengliuella sp.]